MKKKFYKSGLFGSLIVMTFILIGGLINPLWTIMTVIILGLIAIGIALEH
jgi:hypothetical protein